MEKQEVTPTLAAQIKTEFTLKDLEALSSKISASQAPSVTVWLPREIGARFFKDSRLVALLATEGRHRQLAVRDWIQNKEWDLKSAQQRFGTTVEGLASLTYARAIGNASDAVVPLDAKALRWAVIARKGIAEVGVNPVHRQPSEPGPLGAIAQRWPAQGLRAEGKSLTICAFDGIDPSAPWPLAFSFRSSKSRFAAELIAYRRDRFEVGLGEGYSDRVRPEDDDALASFIFELFQNTYEHGCRDRDNYSLIPGLRYMRLKKHITHDRSEFLRRAEGFPELEKYLHASIPKKQSFVFYEISIGDQGLGIVDRFLETRRDHPASANTDRVALLNQIMNDGLSSKRTRAGAGRGLKKALTAVHHLKGFVSLRSAELWLYNSSARDGSWKLESVADSQCLPRVEGTHFSLLFPLTRERLP